jgi:acetyltransferase EpsM
MSESMRQIIVIGADGFATEIMAAARTSGTEVAGIYDDDSALWGQRIGGVVVKGPISRAPLAGLPAVLAFDDPARREAVAEQLNLSILWALVAHPKAIVDYYADVGPGCVILEGAVLQPGSRLGAHVIIGSKATVAHDCTVDSFAQIRAGVQLAGFVSVGQGACLDDSAVVIPKVRVGSWSYVGPGSVVIRDVAEHTRVAGVPARPLTIPTAAVASTPIDCANTLPG